jgi:hypothetical protein
LVDLSAPSKDIIVIGPKNLTKKSPAEKNSAATGDGAEDVLKRSERGLNWNETGGDRLNAA